MPWLPGGPIFEGRSKARLIVAELLAKEGQPDRAAEELKGYLAADRNANREAVEQWLARLEQR